MAVRGGGFNKKVIESDLSPKALCLYTVRRILGLKLRLREQCHIRRIRAIIITTAAPSVGATFHGARAIRTNDFACLRVKRKTKLHLNGGGVLFFFFFFATRRNSLNYTRAYVK